MLNGCQQAGSRQMMKSNNRTMSFKIGVLGFDILITSLFVNLRDLLLFLASSSCGEAVE
jgi:hypothetical protein